MLTYSLGIMLSNGVMMRVTKGAATPLVYTSIVFGGAILRLRSEVKDKTKNHQSYNVKLTCLPLDKTLTIPACITPTTQRHNLSVNSNRCYVKRTSGAARQTKPQRQKKLPTLRQDRETERTRMPLHPLGILEIQD